MDTMDTTYEVTNIVSPPAPLAPGEAVASIPPVATSTTMDVEMIGVQRRELVAPGHIYNPRTGTGIEWSPANGPAGEPGNVRLWARQWNGQPMVLAEGTHDTGSPWEYWYNLHFATSFPQVSHWWFGEAWTGEVCIWSPDGVEHDPESGALMLTGWMRFGPPDAPPLPWTVVLTNPPRVNTPFPPMATNMANLPLQLLMAERVMDLLDKLTAQGTYAQEPTSIAAQAPAVVVTSLVRREDLHRAFPCEFGPWQLDKLPHMTPREALCRVQGREADGSLARAREVPERWASKINLAGA
jgi:hypothetical protein